MALETLKNIELIGGFDVLGERPTKDDGSIDWDLFDEQRKTAPIYVDHAVNMVSFRIQNGPINENGVNGCQVDTLLHAAGHIIGGLNDHFPCDENDIAMGCITGAIAALELRRKDREVRGVEGTNSN